MKKLIDSKHSILKSYFVGIFRIILIAIMARRQKPGISPGFQSGASPTTEDVRFVYDQWGHLIAEYNPAGMQWNLKREYINDSNGVVCTLEYDGEEYERGFHLKDHLGSIRVICTDMLPALRPGYSYRMQLGWTGDYEAFGRPAPERAVCPGLWENPIRSRATTTTVPSSSTTTPRRDTTTRTRAGSWGGTRSISNTIKHRA
jgi:YD repeat-containing protein